MKGRVSPPEFQNFIVYKTRVFWRSKLMRNETIKNQIKSNQFQRKRISEETIEQDRKKDITFMNNMEGDGISAEPGDTSINSLVKEFTNLLTEENYTIREEKMVCCPEINFKLDQFLVKALIDTGSQITCMNEDYFYNFISKLKGVKVDALPVLNLYVTSAINKRSKPIRKQIILLVNVSDKIQTTIHAYLVPELTQNFIIGMDLLEQLNAFVNIAEQTLSIKVNGNRCSIPFAHLNQLLTSCSIQINTADIQNMDNVDEKEALKLKLEESCDEIRKKYPSVIESFNEIIREYKDIFSKTPGLIRNFKYQLDVIDSTPFF